MTNTLSKIEDVKMWKEKKMKNLIQNITKYDNSILMILK